ncbi:glucoside xylosyltransferase 2-like [Macrobrachium rosenbergii]|uniref:glucoside xylosyltransferase 2-like n=1 Tax=Macrobrachium rosenbergii TaxID=79674 RepID=UPI0034D41474
MYATMTTLYKILQGLSIGVAMALIVFCFVGGPTLPGQLRKMRELRELGDVSGFSSHTNKEELPPSHTNKEELPPSHTNKEELPPFIIIVCYDTDNTLTSSFKRQLGQVAVLLKSAVALTSETLRFIVVTSSDAVFEQVRSIPRAWPRQYSSRIRFESRPVWYPPDRTNMKGLLRPCSSARLFLAENLADIDAAVLVDTDTVFLRPPEELLREIYKFNKTQAAGLSPTLSPYIRRKNRIPFPKPRGVNTGVMVMNMTRLRALPGGWTGVNLKAFDDYKHRISKYATNDIINIALAQSHGIFYQLGCAWNYNTGSCMTGVNGCLQAEREGVFLLHGTHATFLNKRFSKFRAVYKAWKAYRFESPLSKLLHDIENRIKRDKRSHNYCNEVTAQKQMLTKSLKTILRL